MITISTKANSVVSRFSQVFPGFPAVSSLGPPGIGPLWPWTKAVDATSLTPRPPTAGASPRRVAGAEQVFRAGGAIKDAQKV